MGTVLKYQVKFVEDSLKKFDVMVCLRRYPFKFFKGFSSKNFIWYFL